MIELTPEIIAEIARGPCIECNPGAVASRYFHKPFCLHGYGLDKDELYKRLQARAAQLVQSGPATILRCHCGALAIATAWIGYHNRAAVLKVWPVCGEHTYFEDERPHGVLARTVTKSIAAVQRQISGLI